MATEISELSAAVRHEFGKGASRRLRKDFRMPAVIYSKDLEAPIHIHLDLLEFHTVLRNHGANALIDLDIEGEKQLTMIKTVDQNVLTFNADHADLLAIKRGEKVEVEVPVVTSGAVAQNAQMMQDVDYLFIEADVLSIPEEIVIKVDGLEVGSQILAADVQLPGNCTLVGDPEQMIINVIHPEVADLETTAGDGEEGDSESEGESGEGEAKSDSEGNED